MDHVMHHFTEEESRVQRGWFTCSGTQTSIIQPGVLPTLPFYKGLLVSVQLRRASFWLVSLPGCDLRASLAPFDK